MATSSLSVIGRGLRSRVSNRRCRDLVCKLIRCDPKITFEPAMEVRRFTGGPGTGEGKGGGTGGSIRSSGGIFGKKEYADEERHFREEAARQLAQLKKQLSIIHEEKIHYHEKQLQRHLESIAKHEQMKKTDRDPSFRDVHIKSHKESVKAHQEMLESLRKQKF